MAGGLALLPPHERKPIITYIISYIKKTEDIYGTSSYELDRCGTVHEGQYGLNQGIGNGQERRRITESSDSGTGTH